MGEQQRYIKLEEMAKLDVTLEPSNAPGIPKKWRDKIKNLIDVEAHYLEQTGT
ncbi:MAG: hypothetical protein Ct9H90mP11_11050 [Acidimicrobiales bacterium]|nr:MAG: hypothetical protein Ct9H90mP11_11050 [Acidimicrobiales bacterium]